MSEADSKPRPGVPSWQVQSAPETTTERVPKGDDQSSTASDVASRTLILENARKFLEENEVKDASTDKKIAFLESKGLNSEEIHELLGISRNREASNPDPQSKSTAQMPPQQSISQDAPIISSQTAAPPSQPVARPYRDAPPIITYPEFLTTPASLPPLITASRLLKTLYLFGGLSTFLYGTTTYLVKPMTEALADSRHELAGTAQLKIDKFIEKLKPLLSEIPQPISAYGERYDEKDDDSSDGDPTELFHRDIGVQTSPGISRPSTPSNPLPQPSTAELHTKVASRISNSLSEVDLFISSELHETSNVQTEIDNLKQYLDTLMYNPPAFSYGPGVAYGAKKDEDDEIGRVKREIRAVKGVLLTARSFPGVGAGVR